MPYLSSGVRRIPALAEVGIRTWFNGPESFTPDGRYVLGEAPELEGLFVAAGFNSIGIQSAGGVGRVMAQWIDSSAAPMDLWEVDVRRFQPHQNESVYLTERVSESLGLLYAMHWPYRQYESARDQRRSPLHGLLAARGACFGELAGWERPNWFAEPGQQPRYEYSYGRQNWFENTRAEHLAVRTGVALFDQTSFAKFRIAGPQACAYLNRLCTADVDVPVGCVVYGQCLNERGGIEADVTLTRVATDEYLYITAAACGVRDGHWLEGHRDPFEVEVTDVTGHYAVLGLMGPEAPALLARVAVEDLGSFEFGTSRVLDLGGVPVRATRITYVGARGWELYVPWSDAGAVFDLLMATDSDTTGPKLAGYHAMDSLRLEKAYRHWGHDITDEDTPLEAGLGFTVAWNKPGGFIGQEALVAQKGAGLTRRLVLFRLENPELLLYHDEPIWADGRRVGRITSGAYGHSVGAAVGFGYVHDAAPFTLKSLADRRFEIEIGDSRYAASVSSRALYDPDNREIRP
jgi:4-methylaminobutanoate oxidase (formaldehyde-forming)